MGTQINYGMNPDLQAESLQLQRQQALADLLRKQAITPSQQQTVMGGPNQYVVKQSPLEGISKLAQAYFASKMDEKNDAKQSALGTALMQRNNAAMDAAFPASQAQQPSAPPPVIQALKQPIQDPGDAGNSPAQVLPVDVPTNANIGMTSPLSAALVGAPGQSGNPPSAAVPQAPQQPDIRSAAKILMAMGNQEGANKLIEQAWSAYAPTDVMRMANAAGADSRQANADALFKTNQIAPVVNRGFGVLTTNPITHKLENDPASMDGIRNAKSYDAPVSLKTSTGQEVQLSPAEWKDYQGTGNLPLRFLPQNVRAGVQSDVDKTGQSGAVNIDTPQGRVSGTVSPSNIGQIGVSQTPFNQALDKDEAGRVSKMTEDIYDKGTHALDKVAQNNKMIELLPQVTTGPLNKQITMLRNAGQSLGVDIGDPAPNQEFDKYAIQGALSAAKSIYGSRITNMDVETQIKSNPGATMGEKAIYQMLKWDNEARQREIQKMTAYGEYKRGGGDPREFPVYFAQKYPYEGVSAPENGKSQEYKVNTPAAPSQAKPVKNGRPPLGSLIQVR